MDRRTCHACDNWRQDRHSCSAEDGSDICRYTTTRRLGRADRRCGSMSTQEETNLINGALGLFGAARVTSINDPTPTANWCQTYYPNLRRALIAMGHWSFAEARMSL